MRGQVVSYCSTNGYGFIRGEDGKEYFFHQSIILMPGFRALDQDDLVEFNLKKENGMYFINEVIPIYTRKQIKKELACKKYKLKLKRESEKIIKYYILDENKKRVTDADGISFDKVIAFVNNLG